MRSWIVIATGIGWAGLAWQVLFDPSYVVPPRAGDWFSVLFFSLVLLLTAVALPMLARPSGSRAATRIAYVAAAAFALASVVNVIEDGFRVEEAFLGFVAALLVIDVSLAAMTIVLLPRVAALVPAAMLATILILNPFGGGFLVLLACLAEVTMPRLLGKRLIAS